MLKHGITIDFRGGEEATANDLVNGLFAVWFVGFCDGEACFAVEKSRCGFIIKLRDDDRPILERISREFRIGSIYAVKAPGGLRRAQAMLSVGKRAECLWLTDLFDNFKLQSKKARDYVVWREAVIAWYSGQSDLTEFQQQIRAARAYPEAVAA